MSTEDQTTNLAQSLPAFGGDTDEYRANCGIAVSVFIGLWVQESVGDKRIQPGRRLLGWAGLRGAAEGELALWDEGGQGRAFMEKEEHIQGHLNRI